MQTYTHSLAHGSIHMRANLTSQLQMIATATATKRAPPLVSSPTVAFAVCATLTREPFAELAGGMWRPPLARETLSSSSTSGACANHTRHGPWLTATLALILFSASWAAAYKLKRRPPVRPFPARPSACMLERTPAAVHSTSMDKQNRLSIMKKAVDTVLQTLTLSDTIAVVAFSDSAEQVMSIC